MNNLGTHGFHISSHRLAVISRTICTLLNPFTVGLHVLQKSLKKVSEMTFGSKAMVRGTGDWK